MKVFRGKGSKLRHTLAKWEEELPKHKHLSEVAYRDRERFLERGDTRLALMADETGAKHYNLSVWLEKSIAGLRRRLGE